MGDSTSKVTLLDAATGQQLLTFTENKDKVTDMVFSPDGKRLATWYSDFKLNKGALVVKVWDTDTGQEVLTLKEHTNPVWDVAFSPDGKILASCSGNWPLKAGPLAELKVWDSQSGRQLHNLDVHATGVESLAFSPDGKLLACSNIYLDATSLIRQTADVQVWDVSSGQKLLTLKGHSRTVSSLVFSADGKRLASASPLEKTVKLWDTTTGQELLTLKTAEQPRTLAFSPDGKRLTCVALGGRVIIWDASRSMKELEQ
jgi:WD40 repeat protein